ncbi:response regulator transcription factor [Puteibacter caeruleilacunae]|nr:response regulator transcription factor [Puteibacter caeruleilacunae]
MTDIKPKILLAEDDETLCFVTKDNLKREGFEVICAQNGEQAIQAYQQHALDLCLLDVMMPLKDGFEVAKHIRKDNQDIPIIFLTARSMTEDKITGLTIGGDDYLTKPFSLQELILKIKIFLRRSKTHHPLDSDHIFKISEFEFNFEGLTLSHPSAQRELTLKEAELLKYLCLNPNKVLSRSKILSEVWGDDNYYVGRSLDVFISRLRKYLKPDPQVKIVNLHGIGFKFVVK